MFTHCVCQASTTTATPNPAVRATEVLLAKIEQECSELCRRGQPSELRKNDFIAMSTFDWQKITAEMAGRSPTLLDVLLAAMGSSKEDLKNISPRIGTCYAILMQSRNHEMSLVQRINTTLMTNGNAKKQVWSSRLFSELGRG